MQTFGERLQQLRAKAGLTQQRLAAASGVNVWSIRGYEQGRREPNWKMAIHLASALGVAVEAFADCSSQDESGAIQKPKRGRASMAKTKPGPGRKKPRGPAAKPPSRRSKG